MELTINRIEHFLKQITFTDRCWTWKQSIGNHGYGQFWNVEAKKNLLAHRVSYRLFNGSISEGFEIDHLCRNRTCVNPKHLESVTPLENKLRQYCPARDMTHCKRGHEFTPANTYIIRTTGSRQCRSCINKQTHCKYGHELVEKPSRGHRRICSQCRGGI